MERIACAAKMAWTVQKARAREVRATAATAARRLSAWSPSPSPAAARPRMTPPATVAVVHSLAEDRGRAEWWSAPQPTVSRAGMVAHSLEVRAKPKQKKMNARKTRPPTVWKRVPTPWEKARGGGATGWGSGSAIGSYDTRSAGGGHANRGPPI